MNTGKIVQVIGPVVDVQFAENAIPPIYQALTIAFTCDASKSVEAKLLARADDMLRKQALAQARAQTAASETKLQPPSTQEPAAPVAGDAAPQASP